MKCKCLYIYFVVCLAVFSLAAGCSSTPQGMQQSAKTVDSLTKVQAEMEKVLAQVGATVISMQKLADKPQGDLTIAYNDYRKQVERLDLMARQVASRNQSLRARAKQYFTSWEKENAKIKSDQIRAVSSGRRAAAQASFDEMVAKVAEGKAAFTPMMDEFRDISLYLSNDLTSAGVTACKPLVDQATANSNKVKDALHVVVADLKRIETELRPAPTNK